MNKEIRDFIKLIRGFVIGCVIGFFGYATIMGAVLWWFSLNV